MPINILNSWLRLRSPVAVILEQVRFATKKAGGSVKNGRDSPGKRLGVKKFGGYLIHESTNFDFENIRLLKAFIFAHCSHAVIPGNIIIRQRGQKFHAGENVGMGRDHTIYSLTTGWVHFKFDVKKQRNVVSVSEVHNPNIQSKKVKAVDESM